MKKDLNNSFTIIVGILLSVSLATFLIFFVEKEEYLRAFFFDSFLISILYVIFIYGLALYPIKKTHFLIPRTILVIFLSILPYVILRMSVESPLEKVTDLTLFVYLIILFSISFIWGIWERLEIKNKKIKWKNFLDLRIIMSGLLLIIIIAMYLHKWGFV